MSNLFQSLEESQQGYQQHQTPTYSLNVYKAKSEPKSWPKLMGLLLLPAAVTALGVSYHQYSLAKQQWLLSNVEKVEVVEVPAKILELSYPDVGLLLSTQREPLAVPNMIETAANKSQQVDDAALKPLNTQPEDELLEGIDFSDLSPEIAQRLQAAMSGTGSDVGNEIAPFENEDSAVPDLTSVAANWRGKLPALNFQTHVYSSDANKRWVKVNNIEHKEGDWLSKDVQLKTIEPQACVIEVNGEPLRMPALYDWQG